MLCDVDFQCLLFPVEPVCHEKSFIAVLQSLLFQFGVEDGEDTDQAKMKRNEWNSSECQKEFTLGLV